MFVALAHTPAELSKVIRSSSSFVSFGVDALRFSPYPRAPERVIDFYAMGRRGRTAHMSLLEHARTREDFFYLYDSATAGLFVEGPAQHRERLANLIQRTRYFMASHAKVNMAEQTGGQEAFGPRFYEGAAAGAILVGTPPKCEVFDSYFDWPDAIIPVPYDSTVIPDVISELDKDPERVERARRANMTNVLRRHDWLYRWLDVLETIGLDPKPAALERRAKLEAVAAAIENAPANSR